MTKNPQDVAPSGRKRRQQRDPRGRKPIKDTVDWRVRLYRDSLPGITADAQKSRRSIPMLNALVMSNPNARALAIRESAGLPQMEEAS